MQNTAYQSTQFCKIHQNCLNKFIIGPARYQVSPATPTKEPEKLVYSEKLKLEVVKAIKDFLAKSDLTYQKSKKIEVAKQMYDYIIAPKGSIFLAKHAQFKTATVKKLSEIIEIDKLPEFIPYYEKITGKPYSQISSQTKQATLLSSKIALATRSKISALTDYYSYLLTPDGHKYLSSLSQSQFQDEQSKLKDWILNQGYHQLDYYYIALYGISLLPNV